MKDADFYGILLVLMTGFICIMLSVSASRKNTRNLINSRFDRIEARMDSLKTSVDNPPWWR